MQPSVCFHVQKIIGVSKGKGNLKNYQVQWAPSWVSGFHLVGCEDLIEQFLKQQTNNEDCIADVSSNNKLNYSHDDELNYQEERCTDGVKTESSDHGVSQEDSGGPLFDDAASDDVLDHGMSPKQRLSGDSHRTASLNINDSGFYLNEGNNLCLFAEDTNDKHARNVEVVSMQSPTQYRDNDNNDPYDGKNSNPNFEWLERNVSDIYDGGSKDNESSKVINFQYDSPTEGNEGKTTESGGELSSFESTFAFGKSTVHSKDVVPLAHFSKEFMNGDKQLPSDFLQVKREEKELATNTAKAGYSGSSKDAGYSGTCKETGYPATSKDTPYSCKEKTYPVSCKEIEFSGPCNETACKEKAYPVSCKDTGSCKEKVYSGSCKEKAYSGSSKETAYSGSCKETAYSGSCKEMAYSGSCKESFISGTCEDKDKNTPPMTKTYKCDICQKIFKNNGSLRRHSKIHMAGGNAFRCGVCYRRFESQANLQKHELIHSGERRYVCNICNKKFSENGNLQAHIRTHTGERPYKCTYCAKMFLTSSDLKRHLRVHTGERPYECKVCHKRFKINDHLQKHTRTHVEERPSMCDNL